MKNRPITVVMTSASVAVLTAGIAHASPTGNTMSYSSIGTVSVYGSTGPVTGTGTASFDEGGAIDSLTVNSVQTTSVLGGTGTITAVSNISGTITGTTFTSNGNTSGTLQSCAGSPLICGPLGTLPSPSSSTTGAIFSVDVCVGGSWSEVIVNGPATITTTQTITPSSGNGPLCAGIGPTPPAGDPNAIPTMPLYGIGLTMLGVSGLAFRRLKAVTKR